MTKDERFVIVASSTGTIFERYDFYLYATLAPFFAALFFPPGNETAALLSAFATYAAGFLVRPFGAIFFGRIGDLVGRKYTFLITVVVMGASTFAVGLLPTYATIGWAAPVLLVILRLLQGLALGGEYGGAATYVAEHSQPGRRGYATSWIQTTATLGFFLSLLVIGISRIAMPTAVCTGRSRHLVELFPTRIRITSMSLPYHIGNGWFGGLLPLVATAMVAAAGNIYFGLWFPITIALMTVVIGAIFLRDTKGKDLTE